MMEKATETPEATLRSALLSLRPPDGAAPSLRIRIDAVPDRTGTAGLLPRLRGLLAAPAVAAALIAAGAIVSLAVLRPVIGPAFIGAPNGTGAVFDPTVEGPGVVTALIPTLVVFEIALVLSFGLIAVLGVVRSRRRNRGSVWLAGASAAAVVAVAVAWVITAQGVGTGGWNGYGPVSGFAEEVPAGQVGRSEDGTSRLYLETAPGQPFVFFFVVHNDGPIPVQLDAIIEDPDAEIRLAPRWTALALGTDPNAYGQPVEQLRPFTPVELEPGSYVTLYVTGKTSACAAGRDTGSLDQAYSVRGPAVELAYSVFGLSASSVYVMPLEIAEPLVNGCTG